MEGSEQYSSLSISGIRKAAKLGLKLQQERPEIAEWYKDGCLQRDIIEKLVEDGFPIGNNATGLSAISHAIRGSRWEITNVPNYAGLLSKDECDALASEHIGVGNKKHRYKSNAGNLVQGKTPWEEDELKLAHALYGNPKLTHQDVAEILNSVLHNEEETRSNSSVGNALRRYEKSLEGRLTE